MDRFGELSYEEKFLRVNVQENIYCSNNVCALIQNGKLLYSASSEFSEDLPESKFKKIALGEFHYAGIDLRGNLLVWGDNDFGQIWENSFRNVIDVACGWEFTLIIKEDGKLAAHGFDKYFDEVEESGAEGGKIYEPFFDENYLQISCSAFSCVAIKENGEIKYWGTEPNLNYRSHPRQRALQVCCEKRFAAAITENFEVMVWGDTDIVPPEGKNFIQISCNKNCIAALDIYGEVHLAGKSARAIREEIESLFLEYGERVEFTEVKCCTDGIVCLDSQNNMYNFGTQNEYVHSFPYDKIDA